MARAKFDKLITEETATPTKTHLDLQKKELEAYAKSEFRSAGSVIKMLLIQKGIIKMNE